MTRKLQRCGTSDLVAKQLTMPHIIWKHKALRICKLEAELLADRIGHDTLIILKIALGDNKGTADLQQRTSVLKKHTNRGKGASRHKIK